MWSHPQFPADLVAFTGEILNEKLHFLCSAIIFDKMVYKVNHRLTCSDVWSNSCHVSYVGYNITVKLMTNLDTGGTITRMTVGKV